MALLRLNDWPSRVYGVNDHEADCEQVVVYLAERSDGLGSHSGAYQAGEYLTKLEAPAFPGLLHLFSTISRTLLPSTCDQEHPGARTWPTLVSRARRGSRRTASSA